MNLPKLRAAIGYVAAIALCFVVMALVAASSGCVTDPETGARTIQPEAFDFITNAAQRAVTAAEKATDEYSRKEDGKGQTEAPATGGDTEIGGGAASDTLPVAGASLNYRYGGFNGSKASEVAGCQIGSLKVGRDKLTYKWVKGGCEALGATSREDYDHTVACVFYWNGKEWIGGKFDWISTSRTSRGLNNVRDGYGGWDGTSFFAAKKHGFVIVSADGKKRSNFIED